MKKITISIVLLTIFGFSDSQTVYENLYANKDRKNPEDATRSGFNMSTDIGYTTYLIDVTSSELSRAIDYNVLEATLGMSYAYANWMLGIDTKILVYEQNSNLSSSSGVLNDSADINRDELSLFINYKINEEFALNAVYRYANLKSTDSYVDVKKYNTTFNYSTYGLASSVVYTPSLFNGLFLSTGLVYSNAKVEIFEKVNNSQDDAFIDDGSSSLGIKLGGGYSYAVNEDLALKLSADWYKFDFGKLNVNSLSTNKILEQASLNEETYSIRLGVSYGF